MANGKKRITLDVDASLQQRLKAVAARKGVSMREYCETALDREIARDEADTAPGRPFSQATMELIKARRAVPPGGGMFEGDSVDFIREAREERSRRV